MALPMDIKIESLTYTHADFTGRKFHLDRILNRMAPISLVGPVPQIKELEMLTVFPAELLLDVLECLSIIDLMRFHRCNRYSSWFVDTMLRTVFRVAPNTVKGIMALRISTHITAPQLRSKLYQRQCDACGKLAQYMYLPTCLRACFQCLPGSLGSLYFWPPVTDEHLIAENLLQPEQLATRPSFRPLPATFTNGMNKFRMEGRHLLYDRPTTYLRRKLGWSPWYDEAAVGELRPDLSDTTKAQIERGAAMHEQDANRESLTVSHDPLHLCLRLHMCSVFAPWPASTASQIEQGVFCTLCLNTSKQDTLYNRDTILEHLKDCRVGPDRVWMLASRSDPLWLCDDEE